MTTLLVLLSVFISLVSGQNQAPSCDRPPDRGQDGPDKGIRYFYDNITQDCYPFLYRGAGANNDNSYGICNIFCKSPHPFKCVGGPSTGECNMTDRKCPNPADNCHNTRAYDTGLCCDAKTDAEYKAERFPTCTTGRLISKERINSLEIPLLGRSCDDQFCPIYSNCVQGKYLAHCCTQCGPRAPTIETGPTRQIRWYYNQKIDDCLAYSGTSQTNSPTYERCMMECRMMDYVQCAFGSPKTGNCGGLFNEKCPNAGDACIETGHKFGICCDGKLETELGAEMNPTCPGTGRLATRTNSFGIQLPLLGEKCSDAFCPDGSRCIQGNHLAHCCFE